MDKVKRAKTDDTQSTGSDKLKGTCHQDLVLLENPMKVLVTPLIVT